MPSQAIAVAACVPATGSTFNQGATMVNCTATDAAGNTAACSFTVTVTPVLPTISSATSASPNPAHLFEAVTFGVADTSPPGTTVTTTTWNFGDGTTGTGATVTHPYNALGTYNATVTVKNSDGGSITSTVAVSVVDPNPIPPTPQPAEPTHPYR